jgi:hypothetical protein
MRCYTPISGIRCGIWLRQRTLRGLMPVVPAADPMPCLAPGGHLISMCAYFVCWSQHNMLNSRNTRAQFQQEMGTACVVIWGDMS